MRTEQPAGKTAWGVVMAVALVAMASSTTMFARQAVDPIETQAVVSAANENEMSADDALVENCGDMDTEQASAVDETKDADTEEASAAEGSDEMDMDQPSVADNSTGMDSGEDTVADNAADVVDDEQASAADNTTDADTEGVSPETGNP
jgi:hypothetical protein